MNQTTRTSGAFPLPDDALPVASPLTPSRLAQAVVDNITGAILDGRLNPGDPLPSEGKLAAAFSISKPIVREAIRDLAAMGIVQIHQGKVARVCAPGAEPLERFFRFAVRGTRRGLANAIEMRQTIEPPIARLAAERATKADARRLQGALEDMRRAVDDHGDWIKADLDFHEIVAEITGNRLLHLQMQGLRVVAREVMEFFRIHNRRGSKDWQDFLRRHREIVDAIADGDGARAFKAMEDHFEEGRSMTRILLSGE